MKSITTLVLSTTLLSACSNGVGAGGVDMKPIGHGLEFLGMALVLAALVLVFGRFIGR